MSGRSDRTAIAVVGGCGIGLTMKVERIPAAGETVGGASFASGPGGKGSNQAVGIARLGLPVALCTMVGPDEHGAQLRALWRAEQVDASAVLTGSQPTMVGSIVVDATGENRIIIAPGALTEMSPASIEPFVDRIAQSAAVLVSLEVPIAAAARGIELARLAGCATVLNPAPAMRLDEDTLALVDHLVPNQAEATQLSAAKPGAHVHEIADALRRRFRGTIVITLGEHGALVDDGSSREHIPAQRVEVVDTTGAGDAFCAAYAVALVEGAASIEAARFATRAGALAVTRDEVIPSLPTRQALNRPVPRSCIR